MKENPLISVVIPVYNPGKHLIKCMDSVLNQTYRNIEVILVDDGSNDGSEELCDKFASRDSRIQCIHQPNKGVSCARNAGIKMSSGDFFHFMDSDDYLELDTYEHCMKLFRNYKCDAVTFEYYITYPEHEVKHIHDELKYGLFWGENIQINLMDGMQFCWTKILSGELVKDLFFREDIYRGEDTLFAAYALANSKNGVYFDKTPLYHYVQSSESACRGKFRESQLTVLKLYDAYKELYWNKFTAAKPYFLVFMHEVIISLYYDLWSDRTALFRKEGLKKLFYSVCKYQKEVCSVTFLSTKQKVKFITFRIFPELFCFIHKKLHHL